MPFVDAAPVARVTAPARARPGKRVALSAAASSDPDPGDVLSFTWSVGGIEAAGRDVAFRMPANGDALTGVLTVSDRFGRTSSAPVVIQPHTELDRRGAGRPPAARAARASARR